MTPQLESALVQVANKLNSSVDSLHSVLVNQAIVDGIFWFIFTIIYVIGFVFLLKYILDDKKKHDEDSCSDRPVQFFGWIGVIVSGLIGVFLVPINIYNLLTAIFNPDYWALQQLLSLLKSSS